MRYYTDSSSTVSLSFALITFYLVRETALTLCLKVYLDGAAKYFRPWRQRLWVKRRSKEGSKRGKKKKIRAQGFDMDCGGRLGSVVKGSQGRPVIGWHWNIAVDLCVCVCLCECAVRQCLNTVRPNISLQPDCIAFRVLICCHHLALEWMLISSTTDTNIIFFGLTYQTPPTSGAL